MTEGRTVSAPSPGNTGLGLEDVARYLKGPPPEMAQYAFFVGAWNCTLHLPVPGAAEPLVLRAEWRARWVHAGRMLVDDLTVFLPDGREVLGWLNLRTFSEETGCWEISGQRALAPGSGVSTRGRWRDGEMHLDFATEREGRTVQHAVRFHEITEDSFAWEWTQRGPEDGDWQPFASIAARRLEGEGGGAAAD